MEKLNEQIDKPSIFDILMFYDKDCSEFYSKDTATEIIKLLKKSLKSPLSEDEESQLKSQIPDDKKLRMVELFKILKNSPISSESDSAAKELYEDEKRQTCLSCLPTSCFRWKRKSAAKDVLERFRS